MSMKHQGYQYALVLNQLFCHTLLYLKLFGSKAIHVFEFQTTQYYDWLVSMLKTAHYRPSIPEYTAVAENIHQPLNKIFYDTKESKQALNDVATNSGKALGW